MRRACVLLVLVLAAPSFAEEAEPPLGTLRFEVIDAATGGATPARVTVLDDRGRSHVAPDAVPVAGECMTPAAETWARAPQGGHRGAGLLDPASGAKVFYVDGPVSMELPAGRYRLTVAKGFEWRERSLAIEVFPGDAPLVPVEISRWVDLPSEGWVSSDAHLHISRPGPAFDPLVAAWMSGEDLHVANLLQMGAEGRIVAGAQYAFGAPGRYRSEDVVLAPGQENPRTWVLGHGIVVGADEYLDSGDRYLDYQPVWQQARAQGGLVGYAHWNPPGVVVDAPTGAVDFLEVLQFDTPNYEVLYQLWNVGALVAPVAGTDFPCIGDLPGADRFYARVGTHFTWERWLDAVRAGRTFVTNGPLLDVDVDGAGIGDELRLDGPAEVLVEARVRFDPTRDDVRALELVQEGEVVHRVEAVQRPGELRLSLRVPVKASTWLAVRSKGTKLDRRPHGDRRRDSAAHSGPIHVRVAGTPPLGRGPRARETAGVLRQQMAELGELFGERREAALLKSPSWLRGVQPETLRKSRPGLLAAIGLAEAWYGSRAGPADARDSDPGAGPRVKGPASSDARLGSRVRSRSRGDASHQRP